jgi:hypothetical protein
MCPIRILRALKDVSSPIQNSRFAVAAPLKK